MAMHARIRRCDACVLVIGCGSIGRRRIGGLLSLGVKKVVAFDVRDDRCRQSESLFGIHTVDSLEAAWKSAPQIAFVSVSTGMHVRCALEAARQGCHLFIEKPLSDRLDGIGELLRLVRQQGLISMMGCNMRFHHGPSNLRKLLRERTIGKVITALLDAGQYLPDWHPYENYRQMYSANRSMGGGVILDGIHEIDYARWLFGEVSEVFCYGGKLSSLDVDVEDSADILLKFEAGFSAMIHLDYIQRAYARSCKIIGEEGTIVWDIGAGVRYYSANTKQWKEIPPPEGYTLDSMYIHELEHFLGCVEQGKETICGVDEAARVTRVCLAIKESMQTGQPVRV